MIMERPPCGVKGCDGKGFAVVGNMLVCRECLLRYDKQSKERIKQELERLHNEDENQE